jgi:hypothetical protein
MRSWRRAAATCASAVGGWSIFWMVFSASATLPFAICSSAFATASSSFLSARTGQASSPQAAVSNTMRVVLMGL